MKLIFLLIKDIIFDKSYKLLRIFVMPKLYGALGPMLPCKNNALVRVIYFNLFDHSSENLKYLLF